MKNVVLAVIFGLFVFAPAFAAGNAPAPSKKDKCPVCGMFVYEYQEWLAEVVFQDGSLFFFDGTKDLMKFYLNLNTYEPHKSAGDIQTILVTEYYGLKKIDARQAYFVIGSDIYGPMGKELIPLLNNEDAEVFMKDHKGARILRFKDITRVVLEKLDK